MGSLFIDKLIFSRWIEIIAKQNFQKCLWVRLKLRFHSIKKRIVRKIWVRSFVSKGFWWYVGVVSLQENHFLFAIVLATMMLVTVVQKRCHQHHCYLEILSAKLHKGAQPSGLLILFKGQMGFEWLQKSEMLHDSLISFRNSTDASFASNCLKQISKCYGVTKSFPPDFWKVIKKNTNVHIMPFRLSSGVRLSQ